MKDYLRRFIKVLLYFGIFFALVFGLFPMFADGRTFTESVTDLLQNQKSLMVFGLIFIYCLLYPLITFVNIKRHLNGSFEENRQVFEKVFDVLQYVKTSETPDMIIYRRKSKFARFTQWYEDEIIIRPAENPVIISGMRKMAVRIDRMIDQMLLKQAE
jgi:hypothetical protein